MNWDDLRFFLELARLKRLNQTGRKLGVDHTTVARRIEQLEAALRCRLFESTVSSGMLAQVAATRAGLGLGVLAHFLAAGTGLVPLLPKEAVWKRTFWLATHADWYRLRRVRAVWDFVRRTVEAETALFVAKVVRDEPATKERPAAASVSTAARVANAVRNSKKRSAV